jgi:serine/threonine-protein kinase
VLSRDRLGRYRLQKEIGRGSMGRVFLAYDPELDRPVALKVIQAVAGLPEAERSAARERFLREARLAARLSHPGIVTVYDVGDSGGVPYLAMEYLEGRTLDGHTGPGALLPADSVAEIVAQAAEALHFAHDRGTVHRDIKPSNLMLLRDGTVKILDFGLARGVEAALTHEGHLLGSPAYMSPEQIRGDPVDGRSDLFSLGVVLYELLCGKKPFPGATVSSILYRIVHEPPQEPETSSGRLPAAMGAVLARALAKNPADRYPTGREFAAAVRNASRPDAFSAASGPVLTHALGSKGEAGATAAPQPKASGSGRFRSFLPYAVGGSLALSALVAAAVLWPFGQAPRETASLPLEVRVRTEPPGLDPRVGGKPLEGGVLRFEARPPFPEIVVVDRCRELRRTVTPEDAGTEVVIVSDGTTARAEVEPGVSGARVFVNGREAGRTPAAIELDLCVENAVRVEAAGFRPAEVRIRAGATPLEARTAAQSLRLAPIPRGRLVLEPPPYEARLEVDGRQTRPGVPIELLEGEHELRVRNEDLFLDWRTRIVVEGGRTARPRLEFPPLASLAIQAYPSNCRAYIRKGEAAWRYLDDTPLVREIAPGRYRIKVEYVPTGDSQELDIELRAGENPPARFSFAGVRP